MPLLNICKLKPIEISVYLSFFPLFSLFPFEKRGKKGKRDKKNGDKFPFLLFFSYLCISKAVLRLVAGIPLWGCERKVRAA